MRILVTGACGYIGSVLVPKLLDAGHSVMSLDICWFGKNGVKCVTEWDIREPWEKASFGLGAFEAIIHLAAVANDPHGDLEPKLTWETNALATMRLADAAARAGVQQFIYASSGSVYGVSDAPQVTEDTPLDPITEYNKTKMVAERCLLSYADKMVVQIMRPATVCGVSPRQRLDVIVNRCVIEALTTGKVKVFGGEQMRPHIHIEDMTDLYLWLLGEGHLLRGAWNAGFENISVIDLAKRIVSRVGGAVDFMPSSDPRSYRMNSDALLSAGFTPKKTVNDAIEDLVAAYTAGILKDDDRHYNLKWMQRDVRRAA